MHRSGTSCLTGSLEQCGVYIGDVRRKGKYNKKGYFESKDVQAIHDQILKLNKSSWHHISNVPIELHPYHRQLLEEKVTLLRKNLPCALKDPRCLLLLDFWKDMIGNNIQFIGTFRHPLAVAKSLKHRNQIPIEKGLLLWQHYNGILIEEHKRKKFPIVQFDLSNKKRYLNNIKFIAAYFKLRYCSLRLHWFVSKKLEHHSYNKYDIPKQCKAYYQYLCAEAIDRNHK